MTDSYDENCRVVLAAIKEHATGQTFTDLKPSMFAKMDRGVRKNEYPQLKGKAAYIKHAAPGLLCVWSSHMDSTKVEHVQVQMALAASVNMDTITNDHVDLFKLPPAEARQFHIATDQYAVLNNALHGFYKSSKLFNVTIKLHYLQETAKRAAFVHPCLGSAWGTEDFVAKVKDLMLPACTARSSQLALRTAFQRYRRGIDLFCKSEKEFFTRR